ncbi:SigB/SigF/SigG family RNA polymerase sigma factor [Luteipulveratus mongoliensis]|uniref:RNA polymerase sigma factor n=1 Tax=Luteipulveratus mongoliensis TaxID=571913 RepID=A0A0K1JP64_9MICO|nr:SigB/SigF/SigG family RNA polymerase sigma factor [Luteipulveratus mongoliensis]AKU18509.1 hypothetical protein VV02_00685 [Luteipulveratus mongoliensis]
MSVMTESPAPEHVDAESLLREANSECDPIRAARLRDHVVVQHRGLAMNLARRFDRRGVELDDLQQVALLGLVLAARRYRPDKGHGFTAFAVPTITGEIKRYFRDHGWAVRPPRALQETHREIREARESLQQELGRDPSADELAEVVGCSLEAVRSAQQVETQYRSISLDTPVAGEDSSPLRDTLADDIRDFDRVDSVVSLRPLLMQLSPREQLIVRLRFVDNLTQRQIGQRIGVSQMQVSRLLTDILHRLAEQLSPSHARPRSHPALAG